MLVAAWWAWIELADIRRSSCRDPSAVWEDISSSPGDYVSATLGHAATAAIALVIGTVVGLDRGARGVAGRGSSPA